MNENNSQANLNTPNRDRIIGAMAAESTVGCGMAIGQAVERDRTPTIRTAVEVPANRRFEDVLSAVKIGGQRATRAGWNAGGQHIESQHPDKFSKMGAPYLVLKNAQGMFVPWVPSQGDLFASDWAILPTQLL